MSSNVLFPLLQDEAAYLDALRQLDLLDEAAFVAWARRQDVDVSGVVSETDIDAFWKLGWLRADEVGIVARSPRRWMEPPEPMVQRLAIGDRPPAAGRWRRYQLALHPFRVYPALCVLEAMQWRLVPSGVLYRQGVERHAKRYVVDFRRRARNQRWCEQLDWWNAVADLAVLLEPLYWPAITGREPRYTVVYRPGALQGEPNADVVAHYRQVALSALHRIPKARVAEAHMELRIQAAILDDNHELYLLLRSSAWSRRERLQGRIGCALWLRHMAEVIRHGYDELYDDRLVHEDEAFGSWLPGARKWIYGSEYPLEDIPEMRKRVLPRWDLGSNVRVRFYVEGPSEQGALEAGLDGFLGSGVEVVNLRAQGWDTWLRQELENDVKARRFSLLMLDSDRDDALRAVRKRAEEGLVIGMVFCNRPDLEFGCFSIAQLCQAVEYYETANCPGQTDRLVPADFVGVRNGKDFEERYCKLRTARSLKGSQWGEALMWVAAKSRSDDHDESHRLVHAVMCAIRAITSDYDVQRVRAKVDPRTLEPVDTGQPIFGHAGSAAQSSGP